MAVIVDHQVGTSFAMTSAKDFLIFTKRSLNSRPQPFESLKSTKILPSISTTFALKINWSFRRSIVETVI